MTEFDMTTVPKFGIWKNLYKWRSLTKFQVTKPYLKSCWHAWFQLSQLMCLMCRKGFLLCYIFREKKIFLSCPDFLYFQESGLISRFNQIYFRNPWFMIEMILFKQVSLYSPLFFLTNALCLIIIYLNIS